MTVSEHFTSAFKQVQFLTWGTNKMVCRNVCLSMVIIKADAETKLRSFAC